MSRFYAVSDSESESESSGDEEIVQRPSAPTKGYAWSDDEEETKRVVRSAKDKRFEEMKNIIKTLKNHKKIKDMANVLSDFEDLVKAYDKAKKVVEAEGIPRFYLRCVTELEDFVAECWEDREGRKAMSKNNAKGLGSLRQKVRKYNRENFETEIAKYRENPDVGDEESGDEVAESGSDDDFAAGTGADMFKKSGTPSKSDDKGDEDMDDDDDDDSIDWGSDSDTTSSSEDESKYEGNMAAMFLKKSTDKDKEKKEKKDKDDKKEKSKKKKTDADEEEGWEKVKGGAPLQAEKPKMFAKDTEVNHEAVIKKLNEITSARGKKGTDRNEQIDLLKELRGIANANNLGAAIDTKILFHIISSVFDYNPNIATCMKSEMWELCLGHVAELLEQLQGNPDIVCGENVAEESENFDKEPPFRVRGCMLTVIERMDEEFVKMLQACDAHSTEYVQRLKDERVVCELIEKTQKYLEGRATSEETCRIYLKRIEHVYYKFDPKALKGSTAKVQNEETSLELMEDLCKYIYVKDVTDRIRTRAILCNIYHQAIHNHWFEARDLMLMSHLQDTIHLSDIPTQIQYNRCMVQLGLCAFRQGMIKDAHNCLVDIQSGGRAKELLAQGLLLQRQHERTPEQEKIEKRRQMPYHMHINLELLECVYLVSAMLLEIPYMAAHEFDARRRMISKNFHHVMRVSDRQPLVGPPESMREHVVAASKAMKNGDWKACRDFTINEKMNAKVWELFHEKDHVRDMIAQKIKEESLRTYFFRYTSVYDSLSLVTLAEMFELPLEIVHSTISKMIINEELMASLDEPSQTVVMHRTEPTRLQSLALQLSEKVSSLVENNERIMEMKQGTFFSFQKQGNQGGYQRDGQQDGYRGNRNYQGDRRNQNYQGNRYGDRGNRNYGDRGNRNYGDRGNRGYGDRRNQGYGGRRDRQDNDQRDSRY